MPFPLRGIVWLLSWPCCPWSMSAVIVMRWLNCNEIWIWMWWTFREPATGAEGECRYKARCILGARPGRRVVSWRGLLFWVATPLASRDALVLVYRSEAIKWNRHKNVLAVLCLLVALVVASGEHESCVWVVETVRDCPGMINRAKRWGILAHKSNDEKK